MLPNRMGASKRDVIIARAIEKEVAFELNYRVWDFQGRDVISDGGREYE